MSTRREIKNVNGEVTFSDQPISIYKYNKSNNTTSNMRSVKYTRLPTTEDSADQHAIDMTSADTFNYSSAFDYDKEDSKKKYASAFTYTRSKSKDIAIEDVGK